MYLALAFMEEDEVSFYSIYECLNTSYNFVSYKVYNIVYRVLNIAAEEKFNFCMVVYTGCII